MGERPKFAPYPVDPEKLKKYYEMEAKSGHRQETMYRESDRWDRYWHKRRLGHLSRVFDSLKARSFLEVGCAEGMLMRLFRSIRPDARRVGLDLSEGYLDRARMEDPEAEYVQGDAASLPFEDNTFDIVLCAETMEHTPDPERVFRELARVTSRYLVVTVPGSTLPARVLRSLKLIRGHRGEEVFAEPGRGHLHDIRVKDVISMCGDAGLPVERIVVDCFVTVRLARFLRLSERMMDRLDSLFRRIPFVRKYGLVQIIVAGR